MSVHTRYSAPLLHAKAGLEAKAHKLEASTASDLREIQRTVKKDPDTAAQKLLQVAAAVEDLTTNARDLEKKFSAFDRARDTFRTELSDATDALAQTAAYLSELASKGYRLTVAKEMKEAMDLLYPATKELEKPGIVPDYEAVIAAADQAHDTAESLRAHWQTRIRIQYANEEKAKALGAWYENGFPTAKQAYETAAAELVRETPKEIYEPVVAAAHASEKALTTDVPAILNQHVPLFNSMDVQEFENAAHALTTAERRIEALQEAYAAPKTTLSEYRTAQQKAKTLTQNALNEIEQAHTAVNDPDAEGSGREKLSEAQQKIAQAQELSKSNLPNWIVIAGMLAGATALAAAAQSSAQNRAREVEARRRRKREEEEAAERRRRNSYSSSSWSSGGGSGGGSFGGFGGGGFGGGGASGGW